MKIAIPTVENKLSAHFGHCEKFVFLEVDEATSNVTSTSEAVPPPHEPGVLPKWLAENKVDLIIAGGMGMRAQQLFQQFGIKVVVGAPSIAPEEIVNAYMENRLETGDNLCDH